MVIFVNLTKSSKRMRFIECKFLESEQSVEHPFGIVDLNLKHIVQKQDLHFNSLRKLKRKIINEQLE